MRKSFLCATLACVILLGALHVQADESSICNSASTLRKWMDLAGGEKSNYATDAVAQLLPRLDKLCATIPTEDTIRYGAAASWFAEADAINLALLEIVVTGTHMDRILTMNLFGLQLQLNKIRAKAYRDYGGNTLPSRGLRITVYPWAQVEYDGKKVEVTSTKPLVVTDLKPGNHIFTFSSDAFETIRRTITVMGVPQAIYVDLAEEAPTKTKMGAPLPSLVDQN